MRIKYAGRRIQILVSFGTQSSYLHSKLLRAESFEYNLLADFNYFPRYCKYFNHICFCNRKDLTIFM